MTDAERAAAGPMVAMETITGAVSDLLADEHGAWPRRRAAMKRELAHRRCRDEADALPAATVTLALALEEKQQRGA